MSLEGKRVGFVMTGSFCTFSKAFAAAERLVNLGADVMPIMSFNAASISSRFGTAEENVSRLEEICGRKAVMTIGDAEPIGPKKLLDIIIAAPTCEARTRDHGYSGDYGGQVTHKKSETGSHCDLDKRCARCLR